MKPTCDICGGPLTPDLRGHYLSPRCTPCAWWAVRVLAGLAPGRHFKDGGPPWAVMRGAVKKLHFPQP